MRDARIRFDLKRVLRCLPVAVIPLLLVASTFPGRYSVPWEYWVSAMAAGVLFTFGGRWPVPVSIGLSVLAIPLFRMAAWGLSGLVPYLGAVAVLDAVARTRRTAPVVLVAGCWAIAVLAGRWGSHDPSWPRVASLVEAGAYVGLPVLLGLYLRGQRDLAESLSLRAAEAEQRTRSAERAAMARELHDLVAHHMASIVLRVGTARHVLTGVDPRIEAVLEDVRVTASDALTDIRRLQVALRDPALEEVALVEPAAVATEIATIIDRVRAADFTVHAEIELGAAELDAVTRLTVMRLVQESSTNVMKHAAPADPVFVTAVREREGLLVRIRSGKSRAAHENPLRAAFGPGRSGHGIIGMRERVELVGGTLTVGPAESGWEVRAWMPIG